jgi:hypothetical protein
MDEYSDQTRLNNDIFMQYLSTRQLATMNLAYQRDVTKNSKSSSKDSDNSTSDTK